MDLEDFIHFIMNNTSPSFRVRNTATRANILEQINTRANNLSFHEVSSLAFRLLDFTYQTFRLMLLVYRISSQVRALRVPA